MSDSDVRGLLRWGLGKAGLLRPVRSFKRWLTPPAGPTFRPFTPHLLLAVGRALRRCEERGLTGDYLEFGISRGFTLWFAQAYAQDHSLEGMRFFGFDSFEGLPDTKGVDVSEEFRAGDFAVGRGIVEGWLTQYGIDWGRTRLIEGWFDQSLTEQTRLAHGLESCAVCVVDCDLYASARDCLWFLEPLIVDETILLFDDWGSFSNDPSRGEQRAFREFLQEFPHLSAEEFTRFGGHGLGFIVSSNRQDS